MDETACKHCGLAITAGEFGVHLDGGHRGKSRCSPGDSGRDYGLNAHPMGTPCQYPCAGAEWDL